MDAERKLRRVETLLARVLKMAQELRVEVPEDRGARPLLVDAATQTGEEDRPATWAVPATESWDEDEEAPFALDAGKPKASSRTWCPVCVGRCGHHWSQPW